MTKYNTYSKITYSRDKFEIQEVFPRCASEQLAKGFEEGYAVGRDNRDHTSFARTFLVEIEQGEEVRSFS